MLRKETLSQAPEIEAGVRQEAPTTTTRATKCYNSDKKTQSVVWKQKNVATTATKDGKLTRKRRRRSASMWRRSRASRIRSVETGGPASERAWSPGWRRAIRYIPGTYVPCHSRSQAPSRGPDWDFPDREGPQVLNDVSGR